MENAYYGLDLLYGPLSKLFVLTQGLLIDRRPKTLRIPTKWKISVQGDGVSGIMDSKPMERPKQYSDNIGNQCDDVDRATDLAYRHVHWCCNNSKS